MAYDTKNTDPTQQEQTNPEGDVTLGGRIVSGFGKVVEYAGRGLRYPGQKLGELGDGVLTEASLDEKIEAKMVGYPYGGFIKTLGWAAEAPGMLGQVLGAGIGVTGDSMRSKPQAPENAAPAQDSYMNSVPSDESKALAAKLDAGNPDKPNKSAAVEQEVATGPVRG